MTDRATARHRAPRTASTPLSGLTTTLTAVVNDHVGAIGRGGAVVAMSSGLVASMGLPAGAATDGSPASGPSTASLPATVAEAPAAQPAPAVEASALLAVDPELLDGDPVSAPAAATLHFEKSAFTAVPAKKAPKKLRPVEEPQVRERTPAARDGARAARASRSSVRTQAPDRPTAPPAFGSARGSSVLAIAARYYGIPYRYGGTTPRGFDCSGFVGYVFRQVGVKLPRTAHAIMNATTRIPRSQARPGDLVFMVNGGRATHMGIYAGDGMMVDSPRTGRTISKRKIYSANLVFGRP